MASYTIDSAEKTKTLPATESRGELSVHEYVLDGGGGAKIRAERLAKPETPLPAVGTVLVGTIEDSKFGKRFKPERPAFNGGRGRSPTESRRIERQHAQHMALLYCQAKGITDFDFADLVKLADAFDRDLNPPGPQSDVPADTDGLPPLNDLGHPTSDEQ